MQEDSPWFVRLNGTRPLAQGCESAVFERPGKASQIIKVSKSQHGETTGFPATVKKRLQRRLGIKIAKYVVRQHHAYLDAALRAESLQRPPPIAHVRGVLLTDLGPGIVVQKIRDANGNPAPTVEQLVRNKLIDPMLLRQLLTAFARDMRAFHIIGYDLNLSNLVYETRHGRSRIVLIDGYGSRSLIPIRRWSRRVNDRSLLRQLRTIAAQVGCGWNDNTWEFSNQ